MSAFTQRSLLVVVLAMLAACASKQPAPVSDARPPLASAGSRPVIVPTPTTVNVAPPADTGKTHIIQRGDTLIGIALSNGLDYRELAAWNNIENLNVIKLGASLRLTPAGAAAASAPLNPTTSASAERSPAAQPQPGAPITAPLLVTSIPAPVGVSGNTGNTETLKSEPKAVKTPYSDAAYAKQLADANAASTAAAGSVAASPTAAPTPTPPPVAPTATGREDIDWAWPIQPAPKGKIVAMFTDANKGVDISGSKGTPVLAAAGGKVVYSGAGLRGYGRLVIIKHNDTWLSAYAHNEKILVAEGAEVKKGQKIAEMGQSDADQVKLHFEIRKQGKPVDPMKFLPN